MLQMEIVFLCIYIDAFQEERLLFVADINCDRAVEFKKAYMDMYGEGFEDVEILQISPVFSMYHNGVDKEYRIQFAEK